MKINKIKMAGVFLLAILMTSAIQAQQNRQGFRGQNYVDREGRFDYLGLTEEQSEELTQLRTDHYNAMKLLRAKMDEIRASERTLLTEESVDLKAVDKVIDEQTDLMNEMRKLQVKHQLAVKEVLTDEQVMKLEQRTGRSGRMGPSRGQGPNWGQGRGNGRGYDWRNDRDPYRGYNRDFYRGPGRGYGRGYGGSGKSS